MHYHSDRYDSVRAYPACAYLACAHDLYYRMARYINTDWYDTTRASSACARDRESVLPGGATAGRPYSAPAVAPATTGRPAGTSLENRVRPPLDPLSLLIH